MGTRAQASTGGGDGDVDYVVSEFFNRIQFMKTIFLLQAKQIVPPPSMMRKLEESQEYLSLGAPQPQPEKEKQMKKKKELKYVTS